MPALGVVGIRVQVVTGEVRTVTTEFNTSLFSARINLAGHWQVSAFPGFVTATFTNHLLRWNTYYFFRSSSVILGSHWPGTHSIQNRVFHREQSFEDNLLSPSAVIFEFSLLTPMLFT